MTSCCSCKIYIQHLGILIMIKHYKVNTEDERRKSVTLLVTFVMISDNYELDKTLKTYCKNRHLLALKNIDIQYILYGSSLKVSINCSSDLSKS